MAISIAEPTPRSLVPRGSVRAAGTIEAPRNTGVTVNGQLAAVVGTHFVAERVPASPGGNLIRAVATSFRGGCDSAEVRVESSTTWAKAFLRARPGAGVAPLTVVFTPSIRVDGPPRSVSYDFGDGTPSLTATGDVRHAYERRGLFTAVLSVVDGAGPLALAQRARSGTGLAEARRPG